MLLNSIIALGLLTPGSWWGGKAPDEATAIARDGSGAIYIAGTTSSEDLNEAGGGLSARPSKHIYPGDVFIQKTTTTGAVIWRAIIGGSATDKATAVVVDSNGAVYVAGVTYSRDFPVSATAFRRTSGNPQALAGDAFVLKLTPQGDRLLYSTYYGGAENDQANALAVDAEGQAVIVGQTFSDDLQTTQGVLAAKPCSGYGYDGFAAKLNALGTALVYGTYLCGSGHDLPRALVLDSKGAAYIAGETASRDFPVTRGAFREAPASYNNDAFVVKLSPDARSIEWGTFYGGIEYERVAALALDAQGRVIIGGETRSPELPGALGSPAGMQDGFLARFSADGKSLEWARLFGGAREEHVTGIELSADGAVWAGGWTRSLDWGGESAGGEDAFLLFAPPSGEGDLIATRFGGRLRDRINAIRLAGPFLAAAGATENAEWIAEGQSGGGQGDAVLILAEARAHSSAASEASDRRGRRPESGWGLWSAAGRIQFDPPASSTSRQRWIVELKDPPAAAEAARFKGLRGIAREAGLLRAREAVRARQTTARSAIERIGGRVYGAVDLVANAFFVEMDLDSAEKLKSLDQVKRAVPVSSVEPDLDASLVTHMVPEGWQRIGGETNAGSGVKLGIIDTGVDARHPALADPGLPALEGFPRANRAADLALTNGKVIVARGYVPAGDSPHANDDVGHGTGVVSVAAGSPAESGLARVSGVAPAAYIGNYKMLTNQSSPIGSDDALLLAFEDAAADGMDVVNMSLHTNRHLLRPEDDIYTDVCERMVSMGVMVVRSTGNEGPEWSTLTNPHLGEWGVLVGNHTHARLLAAKVEATGGLEVMALPGNNTEMGIASAITGPLAEVQQIAPGTWGCSALPANSLQGMIALIDRGGCNFSVKGENARRAGAIAMIVMALAESPAAFTMSMASERIPAFMVSYSDGQKLRQTVANGAKADGRIPLAWQRYDNSPNAIASSSSAGPGMSTIGIKPDLVATGSEVWSARASGGWAMASGTSFSSPHAAGAMAVLLGQRPGLDPRHYRSLIINTATPIVDGGKPLPVMKQGAGRLNLDAALATTVTAYPTSLHFGSSRGSFDTSKAVKLVNIGAENASCAVLAEPREGGAPVAEPERVDIPAAGESWVVVKWKGADWKPGQYDGHLRVRCDGAEYALSIPYWHGVSTGAVSGIKITESTAAGKIGQTLWWAAHFRLTDEAGLPIDGAKPTVTVKSGSGTVVDVVSRNSVYPGIYAVHVRPASGQTVYVINAGGVTREFTVTGE